MSKLPCLVNGHRPIESKEGYPYCDRDQLRSSPLMLACRFCEKKIVASVQYGSMKNIKWKEVDGSLYDEVKKPEDKDWCAVTGKQLNYDVTYNIDVITDSDTTNTGLW